MERKGLRLDFWNVMTVFILAFLVIFLVYPLLTLLSNGFHDSGGGLTLSHYITFFTKKYYYRTIFNSFYVTISVTFVTVLIGVPLAYFMNFFMIKGRRFVEVLIILSMMSPAFIGAYSWILLCGRSGVLTKFLSALFGVQLPAIYGFPGMVLVFTLKLYPFIYMYVSGAMQKIDASLIEAGESLGCHGLQRVTSIILPLIKPTLFAAALMVFMSSMADFGTPMLLGEGFPTMPVLIYNEFVGEMGSQANFASAIATVMMLLTGIVFILQKRYVNKKSFVMNALNPISRIPITGVKSVFVHLFTYGVVIFSTVPLCTVIYTSFIKTNRSIFVEGYSLDSYRSVLSSMGNAIRNTYVYGLIGLAAIIIMAMFIAYLTTRRRNVITNIIDSLSMVPYIIPGSVLGITLLLAFSKKPLLLGGTPFIIILVYIIRRMPHTLRSSSAILYQISPNVEEASISLGASPVRSFFKITAVMMFSGVFSGAILSWVTIINELSASVILYSPKTRTMSVAIYTEVIRGNYGTAAALATILTATTLLSLLIFFRLTKGKEITM